MVLSSISLQIATNVGYLLQDSKHLPVLSSHFRTLLPKPSLVLVKFARKIVQLLAVGSSRTAHMADGTYALQRARPHQQMKINQSRRKGVLQWVLQWN